MTACASGCTIRGQHLSDCPGECTGCLPAQADQGTICTRCLGRLRHDLHVAPDLVAHLRELVEPGKGEPTEHLGKRGKAAAAPVPLSLPAIDAADSLHAELCSWATQVMDATKLTGPSWVGSDIRPARTADGRRVMQVFGVKDARATANVCGWLITHSDRISEQAWARDMADEVTKTVRTLRARWPMEDRPVYLPLPCPACQCQSLVRYAPKWAGADVVIACYLPECGSVLQQERYEWMTRLVLYGREAAS